MCMRMKIFVLICIITCVVTFVQAQLFTPETTINTIALEDEESVIKKFKSDTLLIKENLDGIVQEDELPCVNVLNKTGSQVLKLIFHPGNPLYAFSEFQVMYITSCTSKGRFVKLGDREFRTEKGIGLGSLRSELLSKVGRPTSIKKEKGEEIIEYVTDDIYTGILKKYGQAEYFARYRLKNGKINELHVGFVYRE